MSYRSAFLTGLLVSLLLPLFATVALFETSQPAWGQEVTAVITGRITDPSGAAIAGAAVTAQDVARGTTWPTQTNSAGIYDLPRIPVGSYTIKVEATGFQTALHPALQLEINQTARVDIQMKLGAVTQTVEVTAAAPLLQTDTMQIGSVISNVGSLPLSTRNFIQLTLLTPGVITPNPASMGNGQRTSGGGRPYVNGNRKEANNFLLDGIDNNQVSDNLTSYQPNVDAIQEFNMITNNAPAEFGNFQGGVINLTIKSGTNQFHGDVFEFLRNDVLNANNWARNWQNGQLVAQGKSPIPKPAMRWNMFGGTFGGPIRKDKVFFFGDYQGQRFDNPPSTGLITVVPPELRNGDFSRLLTEKGIQLYNPFQLDANGNRVPFPNNQIPLSMIDPVAAKLFSSPLYPGPINALLQFNAPNTSNNAVNTNQWDGRIDARLSQKDNIFGRYSESLQHNPSFNSFPLFFNGFNDAPFHAAVVDWTRAINPTLVNEARVGVNRIVLHNGGLDKGGGNIAEQLGIQNGNDRGPGLLSIQFSGGLANGIGSANIGTQQLFADTTMQYEDTLIITHGRHSMKTGFQFMRQDINTFYAGNNGRTGFLRYDGRFTSGPGSKGFPEADFFLGLPQDIGRGVNTGTWGQRTNIIGSYLQDDWRFTDNLTLNLGLRWEYHSPWVEVHDRQVNFAPFSGEAEFAGKSTFYSNNRALYNSYKSDFQPRLGFAWTPGFLSNKNTVLRGAYTISSFLEGTGTNLRLPLNPPLNVEFENIYSNVNLPPSTTDQGLTVLASPTDPFKGATIRLWDPNVRPAKVQQWNLSIEHQFAREILFSVGYIGQHGTHLMVPMPYFQRQLLPNGTTTPSPYLAGNPALASIAQISGTESNGKQAYDALQASLHKRLSQGLQFQVSYTWSKTMTNSIGYYGEGGGQAASNSAYWQNLYNSRSEWGLAYFDAKHNFVGSYIYELPFGRKQRFGDNWNSVVNGVLGNWQMSGILSLHSGFPITIQARDVSGTFSRGAKANCIGPSSGPQGVGQGTSWFNAATNTATAAFAQPASGTFGTCGNNTVRGPGLSDFDLGVQKDFPVSESKRFQFRAEFLNLTNTPFFNAPDRNVTSATFGQVLSAQGERNIQFGLKFYF